MPYPQKHESWSKCCRYLDSIERYPGRRPPTPRPCNHPLTKRQVFEIMKARVMAARVAADRATHECLAADGWLHSGVVRREASAAERLEVLEREFEAYKQFARCQAS